jgi:hypothetical protein
MFVWAGGRNLRDYTLGGPAAPLAGVTEYLPCVCGVSALLCVEYLFFCAAYNYRYTPPRAGGSSETR